MICPHCNGLTSTVIVEDGATEISRECLSCGVELPSGPQVRDLEAAARVLDELCAQEGSPTARALVKSVAGALRDLVTDYMPVLSIPKTAAPQPQANKVPSWRLCEMGLPDDERSVGLLIKGGYVVPGYRCAGEWYDDNDIALDPEYTVIAWMDVDLLDSFYMLDAAVAEHLAEARQEEVQG